MTVYTLFNQGTASNTSSNDHNGTLGMQFSLSTSAELTGIWFYSVPTAIGLPVACCIYQVTGTGTGSQVSGTVNTSPTWSGAAGSGWVKCSYPGTTVLSASTNYKVCILMGTTSGHWYGFTSGYWTTGTGSGGLTSGIISAPNQSGADAGQDSFVSGVTVLTYPASSGAGINYWLDVELTGASPSVSLTTPNLVLGTPLVTPHNQVAVSLTTPGVALSAPLLSPRSSEGLTLITPHMTLAAPLLTVTANSPSYAITWSTGGPPSTGWVTGAPVTTPATGG